MSKIYVSDIEIKAKELLSPLQVNCPDSIWQELNYQLNDLNRKSEGKIANKLYTPKALLIALGGIVIIVLAGWKFANKAGGSSLNRESAASFSTLGENAQPAKPASEKSVAYPATNAKTDSSKLVSNSMKDSAKKPSLASVAHDSQKVATIQPVQQNTQQVTTAPPTKADTAALNAYYARVRAYRHKRDSIKAAMLAARDSAKKNSVKQPARDSLTVVVPAD